MDFTARKKKGAINESCSRKKRGEDNIQIRKEKRSDRVNLQRRRYQEEEEEEESKNPTKVRQTSRRNLDALPLKAQNLYSENTAEVIDAATYFRKVLATDKYPPVDLVVEAGVVPRLLQLLNRNDLPNLQLEAAWAITNVACAEVRHVRLLINNGALPLLIGLVANSRDDAVREQSLWALGNISADINDCRDLLLEAGILAPLLWQLGIDSPPHRSSISPSLFTMRHVTWTCCNLVRGQPPPPVETFRAIVYAFAELLQSPDEELLNDACAALVTICEVSAANIQFVMEQGILSRIREMCDIPTVRESAVLVLCAILRSPEGLQVKVLLSTRFAGSLRSIVSEVMTASSHKTKIEIFQTLRVLFDMDNKYISKCLSFGLLEALCHSMDEGVYDVSTNGGHCLCCIALECTESDATAVLSQAFRHIRELLSTTEPALLISALQSIIRTVQLVFTVTSSSPASAVLDNLRTMLHNDDLLDRVSLLASHPYSDIAGQAAQLECLLEQFAKIEDALL